MQTFDPIGVGARDLQECLLLQIRHLGLAGTPVETLVRDHLRLLQNHRIPELARALGIEPEEVKPHIEVIKHLDPKPGSRYSPPTRSTSFRTSTSSRPTRAIARC